MPRTLTVRATVESPEVPELLYVNGTGISISIADIEDEGLRELGAQWTEELLKKAAALREARK